MSKVECQAIILELNIAFMKIKLLYFLWVVDLGYTRTRAISFILQKGSQNHMIMPRYADILITITRKSDPAFILLKAPEQWYWLKVHGVFTKQYLTFDLDLARQEIETGSALRLKHDPTSLKSADKLKTST
jgi:hypothetical protein